MTSQEELSQGHLFTISVTGQGVHRVVGDPTYYEDGWEGPPMTASVRAFSLVDALKKAVELPFETWFADWNEDPEPTVGSIVQRDWIVERTWLVQAPTATRAIEAATGEHKHIRVYEGPQRPWEREPEEGERRSAMMDWPVAEDERVESEARIHEFLKWLIRMDDPTNPGGVADRQIVTLTEILNRAKAAIA